MESASAPFDIREDDLGGEAIVALLDYHLAEMIRHLPACSVHSMPVARLRAPDITFWSVWRDGELAGCGALKQLDPWHGELKARRAASAFLRQGVGEAILVHLIAEARARGYARLSLETGSPKLFPPAHALYRKHGFAECPPFADYTDDPFSLCMTRKT